MILYDMFEITRTIYSNSERSELFLVKFMFSKKATKMDEMFAVDLTLHNVKLTVKISSISVAFLENMNFKQNSFLTCSWRFLRSNKSEQLEFKS